VLQVHDERIDLGIGATDGRTDRDNHLINDNEICCTYCLTKEYYCTFNTLSLGINHRRRLLGTSRGEQELARPFREPASGTASPISERGAALTSHLQSFETELTTQADNRYRRLPPLTADIGGWYSVCSR